MEVEREHDGGADREPVDETSAVLADEQTVAAIRESQAEVERGDTLLTKDEALALITRRRGSARAPGSDVTPTPAERAPEVP